MTSQMAREVSEIPQAVARLLDRSAPAIADAAAALAARDPSLVLTVARGSSDHAATYLKYAVELLAGVPVASVGPSVASVYRRPLRLGGAACVGISQSGRSPDIVEMMRAAGAGGALTVAITNFADSPMATAATRVGRAIDAVDPVAIGAATTAPQAPLASPFDRLGTHVVVGTSTAAAAVVGG